MSRSTRRSTGSRSRGGFTLIEVMVATTLIGVMFTVLFIIFRLGANANTKALTRHEMLLEIRMLMDRINRTMTSSQRDGVEISPEGDILSAISTLDIDKNPRINFNQGKLVWQSYSVFYLDSATRTIRETRVPASPTTTAVPLGRYNQASGSVPISRYADGGRLLVDNVESFQTTRLDSQIDRHLYQVVVSAQRSRQGSTAPESLEMSSVVRLRNRPD